MDGFKIASNKLCSLQNIRTIVTDAKWHDDGFFVPKYLSFSIKTELLKAEVRRKEKDFSLLYEYLRKAYPHVLIPGIPEFQKINKNDEKYMEK